MSQALLLAIAVIGLGLLVGRARPVGTAKVLRIAGASLAAAFALLGGAFVVGETFMDPGGWAAAGLVAVWLLPLAGLAALAWWAPRPATPVLAGLVLALLVIEVWAGAAGDSWRSWEDDVGPVRAVAAFVLTVSLGVLGWQRPLPAGAVLLLVGVAPVLVSLATEDVGAALHLGSTNAVGAPALLIGACYLAAGLLDRWVPAGGPDGSGVDGGGVDQVLHP